MPSTSPPSPDPSSPSSSVILSPTSKLTLSSDLSVQSPQHLYKLSSQYFLTKHFPEASQAILPLLRSPDRKCQQKAWGLYIVILDNALKLPKDEGRKMWGRQAWEREVSRVRESKLWDELLEAVNGVKAAINPEVMMAMIQISLHHGDTKVAQLKVEEWLAAVPPPYPFDAGGEINGGTNGVTNGPSKSKDFYGKVVELYCLVLLPRNEEWDFANTFIEMNEYLSESKKKGYVAKLEDIKATREREKLKPPQPTIPNTKPTKPSPKIRSPSTRSTSTDDEDLLNLPPSPTQAPLPSDTSSAPTRRTLSTLATRLFGHPSRFLRQFLTLLQDLSQDDSFLRTLLFALALIVALLRRDVRARVRLALAWMGRKVRETIGMAGKVGYL